MRNMIRFGAAALVLAMSVAVGAQEKPTPPPAQEKPAASQGAPRPALVLIPVKVQLVLSRVQGEKKISSVPYVLFLTANDNQTTNLRMYVQMPVPSGSGGFNYKDIGTSIDMVANSSTDGQFRVQITVSDSSVYFSEKKDTSASAPSIVGQPAFRSFTSKFNILLRDGQTAQYTSATDQVNGEVMKIDATLNVLK